MDTSGRPDKSSLSDISIGSYRTAKLLLFAFQLVAILIVVIVSLINLSFNNGDQRLWICFLSTSLGFILPNPKLNIKATKSDGV